MLKFCAFLSNFVLLYACTISDAKPETKPVTLNPYAASYNMIKEGQQLVKEGDLILRDGQEFSSQLVKNFCRTDKSYSHAGLVFYENDYPLVYHIVPGDENPGFKLRTDSLKAFCNPRKNFGFAIYRYNLQGKEINELQRAVEDWYAKGVVFDSAFNLKTDDRMYCSEMIKKGLGKATGNRINISTTRPTKTEAQFFAAQLHLPLSYTSNADVVAIDNLFINPHCRAVQRYSFKPTP